MSTEISDVAKLLDHAIQRIDKLEKELKKIMLEPKTSDEKEFDYFNSLSYSELNSYLKHFKCILDGTKKQRIERIIRVMSAYRDLERMAKDDFKRNISLPIRHLEHNVPYPTFYKVKHDIPGVPGFLTAP